MRKVTSWLAGFLLVAWFTFLGVMIYLAKTDPNIDYIFVDKLIRITIGAVGTVIITTVIGGAVALFVWVISKILTVAGL